MPVDNTTPDTAYLTKPNIVHPRSEAKDAVGLLEVTAAEARARATMTERIGVTVSGGSIKRHN
jgi:hypothetical protein